MTMNQKEKNEVPSQVAVKEWYLSRFTVFEKSLNGGSKTLTHELRKKAMGRFAAAGFPTTRQEEWRYTDVTPLAKIRFEPVLNPHARVLAKKDIERFTFDNFPCHLMVLVDGHCSKSLSSSAALQSGVRICSLADMLRDDPAFVLKHLGRCAEYADSSFTALNTAFLQDGAVVYIPEKTVLDLPVHLLYISTASDPASASNPRNLIVLGAGSEGALIESYVSLNDAVYFTNAITEIVMGEKAVLEHDRLQLESIKAFHIGSTYVHQERSSNVTSNSISLGGSLIRNNVFVVLDGEGAEATLNGLYLGTGTQHIDNHTTIDHAQPHCPSHELYKGILAGKSRGVFNGRIRVRKDAQKTDAKQTNKNLILTEGASVDTTPQLEILANDVKCTHGATIGQLDEEAIFYLRARGIGAEEARDILTFAFASDVIERVHVKPLRESLDRMIRERLQQGRFK
jgi:Fe-S cluster assembly protein SufD